MDTNQSGATSSEKSRVFPSLSTPHKIPNNPLPQQPPLQSQTSFSPSLSRPSFITTQYSLIFTYKKILLPLFAPPLLAYVSPRLFSQILSFFNQLSGGCALVSFIIGMCIVNSIYYQIRQHAPTPEKCNRAIDSIRIRLEFFVLIGVSFFLRYGMMAAHIHLKENDWGSFVLGAEFLNASIGLRTATGLFLLGVLVASRFVGYFAIGKLQKNMLRIVFNFFKY